VEGPERWIVCFGWHGERVSNSMSPLFEDLPHSDSSPSRFLEGTYRFLNRVSSDYWQQVRGVIEDWLGQVPAQHRPDLRERLASGADSQFNAAYLELYLHEMLRRSGYEVMIHPDTGTSRRPDFLVRSGDQDFYLEARHIVEHSDAKSARLRRQDALYDALQGMDSPNFFLWVDVREIGPHDVSKRLLVRKLEAWVAALNPDGEEAALSAAGTLDVLKEVIWRDQGWEVSFRAIAKSQEARGMPGIRPLGIFGGIDVGVIDGVTPLKRALLDKASAYGDLGAPFVIALGVGWFAGRDDFDITGALFGSSQLTIQPGMEPRSTRAPNGLWFGGDKWLRGQVTGVLHVTNLHPAFFARADPTLWLHPQPLHSLNPPAAWAAMRPNDSGDIDREPARVSSQELFGLPDPWPVRDAFPDEP